jgi:large subunit ribosomal protein L25
MQELKVKAIKREVLGKKSRFLRRQGLTPAHLFGHNVESLALQCDTNELVNVISHAGKTRLINLKVEGDKDTKAVFVREIQKDAISYQLIHVDFFQVRKDKKMMMDVPIVLIGEAPAMKGKGRVIVHGINLLSVECLPEKVPPQIEIDVTVLTELEQGIHVRDIKLDKDVAIHADPDQLVVKVSEIIVKVEEEVKPAAGAEGAAAVEGEAAEGAAAAEGGEAKAEGGAKKPAAEAGGDKKPAADKKAPEKKAPEKK